MTKSTLHCSRKYLDLLKIFVTSLEDLHPQVRKLQSHFHVRPPHVSNLLSKPPKNCPIKALYLEASENDHLKEVTAATFWGNGFIIKFPIVFLKPR